MRSVIFLALAVMAAAPALADAWDDVLAGASLTRATAHFNQQDFAISADGAFRTPLYDAIQQDPLSGPFYARITRAALLANAASAGDLAMTAAARIGIGTRRTLVGDPLAPVVTLANRPDALIRALEDVWAAAGRKPSTSESARLAAAVKAVPAEVARQAAFILEAEVAALRWRKTAVAPAQAAGLDLQRLFDVVTGAAPADDDDTPRLEALMRTLDLRRLTAGGEDLALAADRAATALARTAGPARFSFRAWTPYGWVILNGAANDSIARVQPNLLILDTGGDDTYASGGATFSAAYPASVLIDIAGNDRYINVPALAGTSVMRWSGRKSHTGPPSFGAGVLGVGILIDVAGNDLYRAAGPTQGFAAYGMGIVQDRAGDDVYDAYRQAQGCADFGVGILADLAGRDAYSCLQYAQGYAGTMGCGVLLDRGADADTYTAEDTVIDDPSAQSPQHNTSMAQGVGNGRRADYSDGHSLAGGVGILLDEGGDNRLNAGIFAQGVGYWMGVGMCLMGPGNDTYNGAWYVQGACAHFAVGLLDDLGGNDSYTASINMAQGAGHDWSVGWLIDHAGNDSYTAPNLSLGSGNANGFGFFWDASGNDVYRTKTAITLGGAGGGISPNTIRERNSTLGIFLDTGGRDIYEAAVPDAGNGKAWHFARGTTRPTGGERGSALDTESPNLPEPR